MSHVHTALQNKQAVTAHLLSQQLLSIGFALLNKPIILWNAVTSLGENKVI